MQSKAKIEHQKKINKLFKWILPLGWIAVFFGVIILMYSIMESGINDEVVAPLIVSLVGLITVILDVYFNTRFPPGDLTNYDIFQWKNKRKSILTRSIGYTLILFFTLNFHFNNNTIFLAFSISVFYLLFICIFFVVRSKPQLIVNQYLTGVGSSAFYISFISHAFYMFSKYFFFKYKLLILYLIICIVIFVRMVLKRKTLNILQFFILETMNPKVLLNALKPEWKRFKDKVEAIKLLKKLSKKGKYGVRQELARELIRENNSTKIKVLSFAGVLLLFIITSVGEGLVQDVVNDDLKLFLCKKLKVMCK